MNTEIIVGIILAAWIGLGYLGHRYFQWREWDNDRRIARLEARGYFGSLWLSEKREQGRHWTDEEIAAYERDHRSWSVERLQLRAREAAMSTAANGDKTDAQYMSESAYWRGSLACAVAWYLTFGDRRALEATLRDYLDHGASDEVRTHLETIWKGKR